MTDTNPTRRFSTDSVVVGVDGSPGSEAALRWANENADLFGTVSPLAAWELPITPDLLTRPSVPADRAAFRELAESRSTSTVSAVDPDLLDRLTLVEKPAAAALLDAATDADLLVVGTRGRGTVTSALLGSVSAHCVAQSTVPVAVVPEGFVRPRPNTIVVGVDGSQNAAAALRWALDHAPPPAKVIIVGCYSVLAYSEAGLDAPIDMIDNEVRETLRRTLADAIVRTGQPPAIELRIEPRDPRVALREIAEADGDLLVVGARGVSGLARLMLGSVANALIHHPSVPTVVVPAAETP